MRSRQPRIAFGLFFLIFVFRKFNPDYPHFIDSWLLPDQPPPPESFLTGWLKARPPLLPPALQFRFPINLVRNLVSLFPREPLVYTPSNITDHNCCHSAFGACLWLFCVVSFFQVFETLTSSHQDHRRLRVIQAALDPHILRP